MGEAIGALPAFDAIADQVKPVRLDPYNSWGGWREKAPSAHDHRHNDLYWDQFDRMVYAARFFRLL